MAKYRLCADHVFPGSLHLPAGTIVSDQPGVPGTKHIPAGWIPTAYSDPLDADAVSQFHAAGVQLPGGSTRMASVPATRWVANPTAKPGNRTREYVLVGQGKGLPMRQMFRGGQHP